MKNHPKKPAHRCVAAHALQKAEHRHQVVPDKKKKNSRHVCRIKARLQNCDGSFYLNDVA